MMGTFVSDIRFAVRALRRRPVFTATAVITLALGIGANASVFTVVNGFLLQPLPYEDPEELVVLWAEHPELGWSKTDVGPADAWDWRARSRTLEDIAVWTSESFNMTSDGPPILVSAVRVTPNVFGLLGRQPVLGRALAPDEVGPDRDGVIVLSHDFWERQFGSDPSVLGADLALDGTPRTVVGIMPPDFAFLDQKPDVLVPLDVLPAETARGGHWANAVARLAEGATPEMARRELAEVARQLEAEYPETNEGWTVSVVTARDELLGPVAQAASFVLMGAVGFILLMACVNVANLLLAHGGSRRRELAVRSALGAGRGRVMRQLLTESLVLAVAGGALGLLLAQWGYRGIVAALPSAVPPVFHFEMDAVVVLFVLGITVASVLLFGVVPALRSTGGAMEELRDGGRGGRSRRAGRFGGTLVVLQTAMAVILLVGGGLLMKSIVAMRTQDFGYRTDQVLTLRVSPPTTDYPDEEALAAFWDQVEPRVAALPGIRAVGTTQSHPLMGSNWGRTLVLVTAEGEELPERTARLTYATPGFFEALDIEVTRGRLFTESEGADDPPVAVVNRRFAEQYLGTSDPLGASIKGGDTRPDLKIVGVVEDLVERGIDRGVEPSLYLPAAMAGLRTRSLVVQTAGAPEEAVSAIQEAVWAVDPRLPLYSVETMEALVRRRVGGFAVIGYLMGIFALLSLILGAVGIYGVTAYSASQRTGEIGVRLAMGAERGDVVRLVVGQGARRAALGLILGMGGALALGGGLSRVLVGVSPSDPPTLVGVVVLLGGVSLLGLWLPARRASRVDPVQALAAE